MRSLWMAIRTHATLYVAVHLMVLVVSVSAQTIQFKDELGGNGRRGLVPISFHEYVSSDNVGISTTIEKHSSSARAKRELRRRIKTAARIVESAAKLDEEGRVVGARVVAIFKPKAPFGPQAIIFWTDRSDLHIIESTSLKHALEFEKQFYR
jgi:hypothetical protein